MNPSENPLPTTALYCLNAKELAFNRLYSLASSAFHTYSSLSLYTSVSSRSCIGCDTSRRSIAGRVALHVLRPQPTELPFPAHRILIYPASPQRNSCFVANWVIFDGFETSRRHCQTRARVHHSSCPFAASLLQVIGSDHTIFDSIKIEKIRRHTVPLLC